MLTVCLKFVRHFQVVHFQRHRSLSVRPSVTSRYCVETTGRIKLVLARRFPSTHPTLCYQEIRLSPKQGYLALEHSRIQDLENFSTSNRSCCQQNSSTFEHVDGTCDRRRTWLLVVVDCVQFVPIVVREIMTAVAELLVSKWLWNKVLHRL